MLGAVLVLLTQTLDQEQAIAAIDFGTLGLLAGMMVVVRLTERTGVYTYVAIRAGQLSRGRPLAVVAALAGDDGACCRRSSTTSRRCCWWCRSRSCSRTRSTSTRSR